jgi:hypothetical protein
VLPRRIRPLAVAFEIVPMMQNIRRHGPIRRMADGAVVVGARLHLALLQRVASRTVNARGKTRWLIEMLGNGPVEELLRGRDRDHDATVA